MKYSPDAEIIFSYYIADFEGVLCRGVFDNRKFTIIHHPGNKINIVELYNYDEITMDGDYYE